MAVASLNKLTVPLTGQTNPSQGLLMPKLKYRFRVQLYGFGTEQGSTTEITKQVMTVTRPEVSFETMTLDIYNSKIRYAGKHTWADATLVVRDDVNNNVSKLVGQQLQKQFDFFEQASAAAGVDYKFTMVVEVLDGGNGSYAPEILEAWEYYGCYLNKVTYQGGDYKTSEPLDISMTITYDNAIQTDSGGQNPLTQLAGRAVLGGVGGSQATGG
jgi:hypothetical protein